MAVNSCEMWSNGIKIVFFPKTYKNRPDLHTKIAQGFAPRPPWPPAAGGSAPRPPSVKRLSRLAYSHTYPKFDIYTF